MSVLMIAAACVPLGWALVFIIVNAACWWTIARPDGHPWNWRALLGPRTYFHWLERVNPPAPQDVKLHMADGRVIPVELVYIGLEDGLHVWEATTPFGRMPRALTAARLPAGTTIRLSGRW